MPTQVTPERIAAQGLEHSQVETIYPHFIHKRLEGKIAIVTGGAKGIGEATVKLFVQHGAKVVIADIDDAAGHALANSLISNTSSISFVHCDVSSEDDIKHLVDTTVSAYGRIDIFFNNAGILGSHKSIVDFDVNEFNRVMSVNVGGPALGMKHAARVMIPRAAGCIISTASTAGVMGGTGPDAYTASKHAVVGLTKNVSCELGKYGIRVNCISPFGVATSLVVDEYKAKAKAAGAGAGDQVDEVMLRSSVEKTVERMGNLKGATLRAKDIAEAALYLASDESKYLSGHNLVVDGGYTSSKSYAF